MASTVYMILYLLIDMLIKGNVSYENITKLTLLAAGIFIVRFIAYGIGYTQGQIGGGTLLKQIRIALGDKFKRIPLSRFTEEQVGQYINVMSSDVRNYEDVLTHKTANIIKNITLAVMLIIFVCCIYLPAGLILAAVSLLFIPNIMLSFWVVKKYGRPRNKICTEAVNSIVEYISGIQTLRAYGMCGEKNKKITGAMKAFSDISYKYEAVGIPVSFGFNILTWLSLPAVMIVAANSWLGGELAGVDYMMVCMMPMLLARLYMTISVDLFSFKNMMISKKKIMDIADKPEESGKQSFEPDNCEICFDNVDFYYIEGEAVLNGASFRAENGKLTAIVGDSGSGKSTILNLISKYYEPCIGKISIGGKLISSIAAESILEKISMVDQDVFLFNDTVRENIRYARPNASDEEIEAACKAANCDDFISKLPNGYDTRIGENGGTLSGGERQRLSIARAILKNSEILLLDEATASLDIENELAVKQAISNLLSGEKTVVMVAHTLSVIKNADKILVISGGSVAESGTHDQLLKNGGKYFAMWNAEQKAVF